MLKEYMYNWNMWEHENHIFSDAQTPAACEQFALKFAAALANDIDLRQGFTVHLMAMWDYCMLDSATVDRCLTIISAHEKVAEPEVAADTAEQPAVPEGSKQSPGIAAAVPAAGASETGAVKKPAEKVAAMLQVAVMA